MKSRGFEELVRVNWKLGVESPDQISEHTQSLQCAVGSVQSAEFTIRAV